MILAAHQPNFAPYMGFFYKMYIADIFTFSDSVGFSRTAYHNYNFLWENRQRSKVTIPVKSHSGLIKDVLISDPQKSIAEVLKRIEKNYHGQKYFSEVFPILEECMSVNSENVYLADMNINIIHGFCNYFGIETETKRESHIGDFNGSPTQQIVQLCKSQGCNFYLSGDGAREYLEEEHLNKNGISVLWSRYRTLEYNSLPDLSVIDYAMKCGSKLPEEWKKQKEE